MGFHIAGKGDVNLLSLFKEGDFDFYELYISLLQEDTIKDIENLPKYINLVSIHNPIKVNVLSRIYDFDISNPGKIGEESFRVLKETVEIAKMKEIKIVVIHGAKYDQISKEEAFFRLAERIKSLNTGNIKLCFENEAIWTNNYYLKPLISFPNDFICLNQYLEGNLKITLDIEHFKASFYFKEYIGQIGLEDFEKENQSEKVLEKEVSQFIQNNYDLLEEKFKEYALFFFNKFKDKIEHIHINGSDSFNLMFGQVKKLPLLGEHLPINYDDGKIKDRLDYNHLTKLFQILPLKKTIYLVIEAWRDDPKEFIIQMRNSKQYLTNYLS